MKISDIEVFFIRYMFPEHIVYEYSGGVCTSQDTAIVRVTCASGEYGIGEVTHGQYCHEPILGFIRHFRELLVGSDVRDINLIWERMYQSSVFWNRQGLGIGVMGGIDIALHDLLGKLTGMPVYRLLGGKVRTKVRTYASNGLFNNPEHLIADAVRAMDFGFTAYKMRMVHPETLISQVASFRKEFGNRMDLIVDAVQGSCAVPMSVSVSKRLAAELEKYAVLWFEEPCRVENLDGYVEVRKATSLNIAGAESIPTAQAFLPYIQAGAFGVVQFDIATSGFTEGCKIAHLAAIYNRPVAIHSWGSVISALAGLHISLALPNCAMTEYCFTDHPFNDLLSVDRVRPVGGYLEAPELPGLGLVFDEDLTVQYAYRPGVNTMISTDEKDIQLY